MLLAQHLSALGLCHLSHGYFVRFRLTPPAIVYLQKIRTVELDGKVIKLQIVSMRFICVCKLAEPICTGF